MLAIVFSFFFAFQAALLVNAGIYVVDPRDGSTCHGGEACTVSWLEDGRAPLVSSIGLVSVGLYTGQQQLVQALEPVDVNAVRAFTFTPNPAAGPNSGAYYIGFTSANPPVNGTETYRSYSPWFSLDRMTGSFETPLPSATAPISISISASQSASTSALSTITVGTLSSAEPITTTIPPSSSAASASSSSAASESESVSSSASESAATSSPTSPSSSGFITITSRSPSATPTSVRSSPASTSSNEPTPDGSGPEDTGAAACSTPVSNRVAIFVTLMVALAFFLL
ncbi:hypothetical protein BKA70DRAFT_1370945 [Coprinopsis sp. MPI-PUGE-AT-0042]|nr:hypothetical protein BKA70DRAFT_1370945 [Coprinopsis sp. MPI-PUGE-AT-0042]